MQAYNVEVFNSTLECIFHTNVDNVTYEYDYLAMKDNKVNVELNNIIEKGNYIRLENGVNEYFGIVTAIDKTETELIVSYKPFTYLFKQNCIFNTAHQGTNIGLERTIMNAIEANFVINTDTLQNIPILGTITIKTLTTNWGFNIKSDKEGLNTALVSLYDVIMTNAFKKYGVVVKVLPDFTNRKVNLEIGKINKPVKYIESGLPNILSQNIILRETNNELNKAIMINATNGTSQIKYYLHPNGTYNTSNTDRIEPVISTYVWVDVQEGQSFSQAAAIQAASTFGNITYSNLIELEVLNDDELIGAQDIEIGQAVNVLYNGVNYPSILSAIKRGLTTVLVFGSVRLDLSKLIKQGGI